MVLTVVIATLNSYLHLQTAQCVVVLKFCESKKLGVNYRIEC